MRRLNGRALLGGACLLACVTDCQAQFGRGDSSWANSGADAQRSSWVRTDPKISREGVQKPDFRFLWKLKLGDKPGPTNSLTPAVLLTKYIGYRGFRDLALVESNSNKVFGIDVDLGRVEWTAPLQAPSGGSCSAGLSAGLARATVTSFPGAGGAGGPGRGGPAHSGVGEPDEGGITLRAAGQPPAPRPPPLPPPGVAPAVPTVPGRDNAPGIPGSGGAAPAPRRPPLVLHVLGADGMIHSMLVSNGVEAEPPVEFVPPGDAARGFIVINDTAYAATGCDEQGSGLRAFDFAAKKTAKWDATSAIAGSEGPAFGPDGTVFVTTTSGDMAALDGKTLEARGTYAAKQPFISSPLVFQYRQRVLAVAATKDGSLHLVDTKALGGSDGQTPLFKTPPLSKATLVPGALASFQDVGGRRWILAPVTGPIVYESGFASASGRLTKGAIATWQVQEANGGLTLVPGWVSREISSPSTPMVVNGVVFAVSSGEAESTSTAARRSAPAVIYALDGSGGKELWNSGKTIASSAHHGRLSAGGSQVYLGTDDGVFYAFGSWIERQ